MRTAATLAFLALISAAHAGELTTIEDKIGGCLRIPVEVGDEPFKVVFEIILNKSTKVQDVAVLEYEPHSDAIAKAAAYFAAQIKTRCWPTGVKTSPMRLSFSLEELSQSN